MPNHMVPRTERAKRYDWSRFTGEGWDVPTVDTQWFRKQVFCPHFIAAAGYILGLDYMLEYEGALTTATLQKFKFGERETQLQLVKEIELRRNPNYVLDVGCGRGQLEVILTALNVPFIAIDFSTDAVALTKDTLMKWSEDEDANKVLLDNVKCMSLKDIEDLDTNFDTVVFSESIEHIPEWEFERALSVFVKWKTRLIIVNWLHLHPINVLDDWNHIREINDKVFDNIASKGQTIFRLKSHLVVQF